MERHRAIRLLFTSAALAASPVVMPATVHAQAFGLNEIGSCAVSRAFANTASPCKDASTIFWNPAAAASLPGWNVTFGAAAIDLSGSFTQDTTLRKYDADLKAEWVPHVFINYHNPKSKWAWGIGMYVPYGLTSQWTDSFPGRFSAKKASLQTIYVQPNFAYQISPNWSIGAGPIWGHSSVELIQAVDLSQQLTGAGGPTFGQIGIASGTEFARVRLKGSADAFGAQFGIQGHPSPNWMLGLRFLTPLDFKYDDADATFTQVATGLTLGAALPGTSGTIPAGTPIDQLVGTQFATGGPLTAQKASTKITHPAQVQGGIAYSGFKSWLLEADYAWVGWKRFDVLPVDFQGGAATSSRTLLENYNNSSSIRLGAEYTTSYHDLKLRGGFSGVASAAPPETVTPLLPEQDRTYWTGGLGLPIGAGFALDAAYARINTNGARGRIAERTTTQNTTATAVQLNTGVFDLSANIFSISLKYSR
ncbi:MAG TPA: outer membrane protein transport protein [Gemmatimonadaceae bacterium]